MAYYEFMRVQSIRVAAIFSNVLETFQKQPFVDALSK